jgi:hypothetical protein
MTADLAFTLSGSSPEGAPTPAGSVALLVSKSRERALVRRTVVGRLLALDEAGKLGSVHARIAAESAGVSVRTVWNWLAAARRSGRLEALPRQGGFTVSDQLWVRLSGVGGNVSALHRELTERPEGGSAGEWVGPVPSLATLQRVVRRERQAGRVLAAARPGRGRVDPVVYDRALAELALPGTVDEAGQAPPAPEAAASAVSDGVAVPVGVRLYVPGAYVVSTRQLGEMVEAVAHTVAARGIACVYGDAGQGKSVAVYQALRLLPRRGR